VYKPKRSDVHPDRQRDHGQDRCGREPAAERRCRVAEHDSGPVGGREQQPPREAAFEVARDAEAGEHSPEGRRLEQHEHELESGVALAVVESRHLPDAREAARERREEEERKEQRGDE
jgi:hypothetical protein